MEHLNWWVPVQTDYCAMFPPCYHQNLRQLGNKPEYHKAPRFKYCNIKMLDSKQKTSHRIILQYPISNPAISKPFLYRASTNMIMLKKKKKSPCHFNRNTTRLRAIWYCFSIFVSKTRIFRTTFFFLNRNSRIFFFP